MEMRTLTLALEQGRRPTQPAHLSPQPQLAQSAGLCALGEGEWGVQMAPCWLNQQQG